MLITLDYGDSKFQWNVEGAVASGTFVDGSPWIVAGAGAVLTSITPAKEQRTTTTTNGVYLDPVTVWINGSAKNPIPSSYHDPNDPRPYDQIATLGSRKYFFDQRIIYNPTLGTQTAIDAEWDEEQSLELPCPLVAGDVIVTADSVWWDPATATPEEIALYGTPSTSIPNSIQSWRTGIKRIGVLTVLAEAPTEPCFRPPFQWFNTDKPRPAPIPLSRVIADESPLEHNTNIAYDSTLNFSSPVYHEGHPIKYQSSTGSFAVTTRANSIKAVNTYFGNAGGFIGTLLRDATNTRFTREQRDLARNRIIQYGIDAFGCALSLAFTSSGAGQRPAELKPWILLAGWWLNDDSMKDVYSSVRAHHAGTVVGSLPDKEIGYLLFHDDYTCRQVTDNPLFGAKIRKTWQPGTSMFVTSAENVTEATLFNTPPVFLTGTFAKLNVNLFDITTPTSGQHERKTVNYYGACLKVISGPGSGSTIYRVINLGSAGGFPADYLILDRPWVHGIPDGNSTVELFAARNGTVDADRSDIGRYHFSREGQTTNENHGWDDMSYENDLYAMVSQKVMIFPYAGLKRLRDVTGDVRYVSGETWGWLAEVLFGTGKSLKQSNVRYGECPDSERIQYLGWDKVAEPDMPGRHNINVERRNLFLLWLGADAASDYTRIPGTNWGNHTQQPTVRTIVTGPPISIS